MSKDTLSWFEQTLIALERDGWAVVFRLGYTATCRCDLVPSEGRMWAGEGDTHEAALRAALKAREEGA